MNTLGLDISTSIIGVSILSNKQKILLFSHIDLRKIKGFWNKIDFAKKELQKIFKKYKIANICVEEPLKRTGRRKSSIDTIVLLQRFNSVVCYICREETAIEPLLMSAIELRKLCGIMLLSRKKSGLTQKEQTFRYMLKNNLKKRKWKKTRNGNYQTYHYDECDAYVVALGFLKKYGQI